MNRFARFGVVLVLILGCLGWFGVTQPAMANGYQWSVGAVEFPVLAEVGRLNLADDALDEVYGAKIDLNNTDVRAFRRLRGLYPTLAKILVKHSPYERVEDILQLSELTDKQRTFLQDNLDLFIVNPPVEAFVEGQDRINPGIYR